MQEPTLFSPAASGSEQISSPDASRVWMGTNNIPTAGPRVRPGGDSALSEFPSLLPRQGELGQRVPYRSRAAWEADESLRFDPDGRELFPVAFFNVQALTVHHTAIGNDDTDPAARVRVIYFDHTVSQEFGDIGYHLLIDEFGTVYEGRWSGSDPFPIFADPSTGGPPQMSNGAHVLGFNAGNIGVALRVNGPILVIIALDHGLDG